MPLGAEIIAEAWVDRLEDRDRLIELGKALAGPECRVTDATD